MAEIQFTRRELYNLVWSEPFTSLSKKYKISDVGLRKICVKLWIPLPPKGYWLGERDLNKILPLPGEEIITLSLREENDLVNPLTTIKKEIDESADLPITVPSVLDNPDKLIVEAKKSFKGQKSYDGMVNSRGLTIKVSPDNVTRALLFMDTLIKLLRVRGHDVVCSGSKTYAVVEEMKIEIGCKEKFKKVPLHDQRNSIVYKPSGILFFYIKRWNGNSEWKDGKIPVEEQLPSILAKLELRGKEDKEKHLEWEREKVEKEEKENRALELKNRKDKELSEFKRLLMDAERWRHVSILRDYIDSREAYATANSIITDDFKTWLNWARQKANWYDPYIEMADELLKDIDRTDLLISI